jgi:hypothetical protein
MGTISDKLMRIINTKEDIRQALISKGYDVPTSIPFKEYAKMILDLPCKVDSFPDIEGIVARYSASGLTNEQMAANPVWVDKTGNGHDLQMKNFAWGGMSGVGGYEMNFNLWTNNVPSIPDISMSTTTTSVSVSVGNSTYNNNLIYIHMNNWDINKNHWLKVTSTYEDGDLVFKFYNDNNSKNIELPANGYVNIPAYPEFKGNYMYISTTSNKQGSFTIEQLPLYPGALVFDGVDDYGTCDNFPVLTKEKGYTVVSLRKYITPDPKSYLISNGDTARLAAFLVEGNFPTIQYWNFGAVGNLNYIDNLPYVYQTSKEYNGRSINKGDLNEGVTSLLVCKYGSWHSNAAIWEIVILDHDATEEELTKIKDYFVKTYPWLFFDQAWTVTGKTNEDEDRATIANITGNGNNLVLSNFGFAEGSGYGLYNIQKFTNWNHVADRGDIVKNGYSVTITNSKITGSSTNYNTDILYSYNSSSTTIIFKVTGLVDGQKIFLGRKSVTDAYVIDKDGIYRSDYNIPQEGGKVIVGIGTVGFTGECNITIEQIPEYEGYLVTDGVDDKITSSTFEMGNDWTVIGDWELINTGKNDNAGIVKFDSIVIYNYNYNYNSVLINIKNGRNILIPDQNTVNAICSDGRIYSKDWKESIYNEETESTSKNFLTIGYSGNAYTKIAFKNLAIYPTVLSREDCIKAYNYLQTLKAK